MNRLVIEDFEAKHEMENSIREFIQDLFLVFIHAGSLEALADLDIRF